jgi:alanine dehydrogenase
VLKGEITHPAVGQALGMDWRDPFGVWADTRARG